MLAILPADTQQTKPTLPRAVVALGWASLLIGVCGVFLTANTSPSATAFLVFLTAAFGGFAIVLFSAVPLGLYQMLVAAGLTFGLTFAYGILGYHGISMSLGMLNFIGAPFGVVCLVLALLWLIPRITVSGLLRFTLVCTLVFVGAGLVFYGLSAAFAKPIDAPLFVKLVLVTLVLAALLLSPLLGIFAAEFLFRAVDRIRVLFGAPPPQKRTYAFAEGRPIEDLP